jgi:hypothetical protein
VIVFVAGMQRSGSTFAFNVAREALSRRGSLYQQASPDFRAALEAAGRVDHVLIKAHESGDLGVALARQSAMRVICTVRRLEDAVASFMEIFGASDLDAIEQMRRWLQLYARIREFALTIHYETLDSYPAFAARRIGRYLFSDYGWGEARKIAHRHSKMAVKERTDHLLREAAGVQDLGFSWYDKMTFFHRRHVSSLVSKRAEERISAEQLARIRSALATEIAALPRTCV